MFTNFIYFIIVLLIYSTFQPSEETNFGPVETAALFVLSTGVFAVLCRLRFSRIEKQIGFRHFHRSDREFNGESTKLSVGAIVLFTIDVYVLNLPSFFIEYPPFSVIPTLLALLFFALFVLYLAIVWASAHPAYAKLYGADEPTGSYVASNISFAVPIIFPWLFLSGVSDIVFALPFDAPKNFLSTTGGQVAYFLFFLVLVSAVGPAIVQRFWRCKPLEPGIDRTRIENLCVRAEMKYADILYWPIFGGRMITAGVMGLIKRFRYILVTEALLQYLSPVEIDAVVAHEIGHVKKKHIAFYLVFFAGYMLLSFAVFDLIIYLIIYANPIFEFAKAAGMDQATLTSVLFSLSVILVFLVYFRFVFGYFMRNFERQADCYVYTLFNSAVPLITTLEKIAITSGSPPDTPNWHHFSISERIDYLKKCEIDKSWIVRQDRKIKRSIAVYLSAMILAGAAAYVLNFSEAGKRFNTRFFEKIILSEIEKDPRNANLYSILGDIYFSRKNYGGVVRTYETSLYLDARNPQVMNNLAWLYATCEDKGFRNPQRALELAKTAASMAPEPYVLDTLAESYYANGMADKAAETAEKALEVAKTDIDYYRKQLEKFRTQPPPVD